MTPVVFLFVAQVLFNADQTELEVKYKGNSVEDCTQMAAALIQAIHRPPHTTLHVVAKCEAIPGETKS